MNFRRWWTDRLGGNEAPPLFTWEEASALRWGPAVEDQVPGIVIDRPDRERMIAAFREADPCDDYALAERAAIRAES